MRGPLGGVGQCWPFGAGLLQPSLIVDGVTRSQPIPARVSLLGSMLRASGDFTLSQADYNIKPFSFAGGALKLKDELKFSFEIVARRQE